MSFWRSSQHIAQDVSTEATPPTVCLQQAANKKEVKGHLGPLWDHKLYFYSTGILSSTTNMASDLVTCLLCQYQTPAC